MNIRLKCSILAFLLSVSCVLTAQPRVTAVSVMNAMERTFAGVKDFTVTVDASVEMERLRVPNMHATMYFKIPDKVHFTSDGFVLLPREGLVVNPKLLRERYAATLQGSDTADGRKTYRLLLKAREEKNPVRSILLQVDAATWTPVRFESEPYPGRRAVISFVYEKVGETVWLPSSIRMQLATSGTEAEAPAPSALPGQQYEDRTRGVPKSGSITIRFSDYRLNTGLSDEVFKKTDEPPSGRKP